MLVVLFWIIVKVVATIDFKKYTRSILGVNYFFWT